jgi:hypothetical protein
MGATLIFVLIFNMFASILKALYQRISAALMRIVTRDQPLMSGAAGCREVVCTQRIGFHEPTLRDSRIEEMTQCLEEHPDQTGSNSSSSSRSVIRDAMPATALHVAEESEEVATTGGAAAHR